MQALLKLINLCVDLIQAFLNRQDVARRDDEVQAIRNDPAGQFLNEFGCVPVDASKTSVSSGEAGAEVVKSK